MHIRKAKLSDLSTIEHLISKTKEAQMPSGFELGSSYHKQLIKNGVSLIAEFEDHFAGFLLAEADKKTGFSFLTYLAIVPKYRGLGLGSKLIGTYLEACKKRGMRFSALNTYKYNKKAHGFYKKHGFVAGKPMIPFYKKIKS